MPSHPVSFHVLHAGDVAQALVAFAQANHATLLILGSATHGLSLQRVVPTVPVRVAMAAPCSVLMVKQALPVSALQAGPAPPAARPLR
ncbi:universal stress protein [Ramlibacter tataouinensis]|nr:universal stress protein [Ramlibacter tataouinensis]WBY03983.1 universal stress protein [Ramlibacter tataouinensis]